MISKKSITVIKSQSHLVQKLLLVSGCDKTSSSIRFNCNWGNRSHFDCKWKDEQLKLRSSNSKLFKERGDRLTFQSLSGKRLMSTVASIEEKFSGEDIAKILEIVNEINSSEDFKRFVIPKKKIDELMKIKNDKGAIGSIDDLVAIVGVKSSNRFFCSILDRPSQNVSNPMFPIPTPEQVEETSKVLSVSITGGRVSWCVISRQNKTQPYSFVLESLVQKPFPYQPRMHFLTILTEMSEIAKEVPAAPLCLVEEYPNTIPNPYMFTFQLQMTQMRSLFLGNLVAKQNPPRMVSIKSIAVARMFNTYVGSERVSGQHLVDNMTTWKPLPSLIVPDSVLTQYTSADPKEKEGMSNVFLLNLGYWKLTKQFTADVH